MATIEKAIEIAAKAHAGTTDRQGTPYILHSLSVMNHVEGLDAKIVAVLHDVVEDTDVNLDRLRGEGFTEEIIEAVRLMTRGEDQSYADYVVALSDNELAKRVKLADLRDNSRAERALLRPERMERDLRRIARYHLSWRYLTGGSDESQYRAAMKEVE